MLAAIVGDVELAHVFGAGAIVAFGFDVDLPLAAEAVEVIHQIPAHEGLQGLVHLGDVDALALDLGSIDIRHNPAEQSGR